MLKVLLVVVPFASLLAEQSKLSLLGLEAGLVQALQGLLARRMLLAADNAPLLRLHEILARQATARVLGRAVENLRLCSDRGHLTCGRHYTLY